MAEYTISEISKIIGQDNIHDNAFIQNISIDSRTITDTKNTLFFALTGTNHNAHHFIPELYKKGVRHFVVSTKDLQPSKYPDANFIFVNNTLKALQNIASFHRKQFKNKIIGITGSNGKTIVKEWLFHCLAKKYSITRSPKSYNSQVGVPLSLWKLNKNDNIGIFEAGISQPGEMEKLQAMIQPEIGIFTNIGEAHQENFMSLDQKIDEKLALFKNCKTLIYCKDHHNISSRIEASGLVKRLKSLTWGKENNADIQIKNILKKQSSTSLQVTYEKKTIATEIPFIDEASIENAMHVLTCLLLFGLNEQEINHTLQTLSPIAMRLEIKKGINNCTIINDSYNSDINSLAIALDLLNSLKQHKNKTLILSDIYQTGLKAQELYKSINDLLHKKKISRLIGIGEQINSNKSVFNLNTITFENTDKFLAKISSEKFDNEGILLKGSRYFKFERIASVLEQKLHNTRLEINLNALTENLNYYRSLIKPDTKIMVMVKALSYGSGTSEIANLLQYLKVDYLGVAFADEGVELRKLGIDLPILVMNPDTNSFDQIIQNRLEPEIFSFTVLDSFRKAVDRNQVMNYPVHIKLDTGMHRLGFIEKETDLLCQMLKNIKEIKVISVFSHLAASEDKHEDNFTRQQIEIFNKISEKIKRTLNYPIIKHILNSSGIERFKEAQFDMVRLGIGLYGYSPNKQKKLKNISTLRTIISQIKDVPANETIGYNRKGIANKNMKLAVIPIGYADGLDRKLGNGIGKLLINNKFVPIIGNICMDMCMADVTNVIAKEGNEVIVFGDKYPVSKLAEQVGTIPYEILTGISSRVKRIYFHE